VDEISGQFRIFTYRNEEVRCLYTTPSIVGIVTCRSLRGARCLVTVVVTQGMHTEF
jgi:hypothetical protein